MNPNPLESVPPSLPVEESASRRASVEWAEECYEYFLRLLVIAVGIFLGWIAAFIIGLFTGLTPIC